MAAWQGLRTFARPRSVPSLDAADAHVRRAIAGAFIDRTRSRRSWARRVAAFAVVTLPVLGGAACGLGDSRTDAPVAPAVSSSSSASPSLSPSPSARPSASPSPSASATTTATTTTTADAPPPPAGSLPGAVTGVNAHRGGGSGETVVEWDASADATGYRVYRAATADGPFVRSAKYTVATGRTTVYYGGSYEVIQIFPYSTYDLHFFQYTEASIGPGCFRVAAFNDAGAGPKSDVVCANPMAWNGSTT